jgi:hypothetical protein
MYITRYVIHHVCTPQFLNQMTAYDVARMIYWALVPAALDAALAPALHQCAGTACRRGGQQWRHGVLAGVAYRGLAAG